MSRIKKRPKQRLSGAMGAHLAFNATYLVSTATYCCKLSFNVFLTGQDHGDISLAGVWLHKERFLRTSSIVMKTTLEIFRTIYFMQFQQHTVAFDYSSSIVRV